MQRQKRACGVKALQAIKENSLAGRVKGKVSRHKKSGN